jgi:DNA-binding NtrC family response regulator
MAENAKRVLLVDDEEKLLASIARRMEVLGFVPFTATNGMAAIDIARKHPIDLAIVDLQMPDMDGLVTITKLKEIKPSLKTALLTGHGNEKVRQATESLNTLYFEKDEMGGFWRFIKQLNTDGSVVVIRPAATSPSATTTPAREKQPSDTYPANEIEIHPHRDFGRTAERTEGLSTAPRRSIEMERPWIVGETQAMQALRKDIERMASLDCTVTLRGEPGTGKELAARAIHAGSMRRHHRFLAVNCANFSSEQLAGQLFGYQSGDLSEAIRTATAFSAAVRWEPFFSTKLKKCPFPCRISC